MTFGGLGGGNDFVEPNAGGRRERRLVLTFAAGPRRLGARRDGGFRRRPRQFDLGRDRALLRMFRDHLAALLLPTALLLPRTERAPRAHCHPAEAVEHGAEQTAKRELRRHDDRQEDQRQDDNHRAGAIERAGQHRRQPVAGISARTKRLACEIAHAEHQAQERADADEQQRGAGGLRAARIDRPAPEVMPADDDEDGRKHVSGVADELEREFGEKRTDAPGEVGRRGVQPRAEEPHRVRRLVGRERDHPDQRGGKEHDADELAGPA